MDRATAALVSLVIGALLSVNGSSSRAAEEEKAQAVKYHVALQRRPEPGYLFDRFYNAWLDQSTVESLQDFLQKQLERSDTTANRLLLAFFHSKQNNDPAAIEELAKALKKDPARADAWYYKALAESRTLDFETAIADLNRASEAKPTQKLAVAIQRQLGTTLVRNRQTNEAVAVWKKLLAANPDDDELREDVIELHIEEGLFQQAAELQESLITKTKDPYMAVMRRLRLGDIHHRAGNRQKAIDVYASTLRESAHDTWLEREILSQIEQIYRLEDDLSGLKKQYATLIQTYPKRIGLQRRRCRLLAELGEQDEAIKGYRAILEITPGDRANREEYVDMLCRVGRHADAVKELEALCSQNPKDAELQVRLAKTLHEAKQPAKAIEAVKQYLKISDKSEYAHLRAARLIETFGDKENAKRFYRNLSETFADSPSAQEALAVFLYADGRKEDSLAIWKKQFQSADLNQSLQIARSLETRGEDAVVWDLLNIGKKKFGDDPLFLAQLINTAIRLKRYEQAMPWVKQRVELAKTPTELETAMTQAVTVIREADKLDKTISELKAANHRPITITCLLAELLESIGESKQADDLLRLPSEKGDALAVGEQIRLHSARAEWTSAAEATRRLLEMPGVRQSQYVRKLVELYERDGRTDEALKWVETWKRVSPGATMPWYTEVRLLQLQGKVADTQAALRKAIQRFESEDEFRVQLAQTYQESGKLCEAERVYWLLYEKANDVGEKLRWVGELARLAQREDAVPQLIEQFKQRSRNNRQSIVPLLALAEIYRVVEDNGHRRQTLLAATKLKPDDLQLLTQIARLEELDGDWKSAVATLEQAAKLDKTDQTRRKIVQLHFDFGDWEVGFALQRESLGEHCSDPRALERTADSLCAMQEWNQAVDLLGQQIVKHPKDYRLRFLLGVAYEESEHPNEAVSQFLQVLDNQEEVAGIKRDAPENADLNRSYSDFLRRLLPGDAFEWIAIQEDVSKVYAYQQRSQAVRMGASVVRLGSLSFLPPSVDEARRYALTHLLALFGRLDDSQKAALAANLKTNGIRYSKVFLKLGIQPKDHLPTLPETIQDEPENEPLLALFVLTGLRQPQEPGKSDRLVRAFKMFRENRPELAMIAAVQAATADEKYASLVDEAVALRAKISRPNPILFMAMTIACGGQPWAEENTATAISQEQRKKIITLLVDWYPEVSDHNNVFSPLAFFFVAGALRAGGEPQSLFAMLDSEVERWRDNGAKQSGLHRNFLSQSSSETLLAPIDFPPQELTDLPPNIRDMLLQGEDSPFGRLTMTTGSADWGPDKMEPLIRKVKEPTLRILLAHRLEFPKIVESTLQELLQQKPPKLDACLLAAGKANADSRFADAVELLEKARQLPMKQDLRRRVDGAIVASAIAAKDSPAAVNKKGLPCDTLLKLGQDAALRLRCQRLDRPQREQLAMAMAELELKTESEKLEKQISAASVSSLSPYLSGNVRPLKPVSDDGIRKMLVAGKRDAAIRQLAGEGKMHAQELLGNGGYSGGDRQKGRTWERRVRKLGMADDVVKYFTPNGGSNLIRWIEYAAVCEIFGRNADARNAYERILAKRPKDDLARVRLIFLTPRDADRVAIDKQLSQLSDAGVQALTQMLRSEVTDDDGTWEERQHQMEMGLRLFVGQKESRRANLEWAVDLVRQFGSRQNSSKTHAWLPSLYARREDDTPEERVEVDVLKRRAQLHHDFCLQLLTRPEIGRDGFHQLLAAAESRGDVLAMSPDANELTTVGCVDPVKQPPSPNPNVLPVMPKDTDADLLHYAECVLLGEAQADGQRMQMARTMSSSEDDDQDVRFRSPEKYLVVHAWRSRDWRSLDEKVLPKLRKARNPQPADSLDQLAKLYRCPSRQFVEVAKTVLRDAKATMPMMRSANKALLVVTDVWAERKLSVDIQPMVLDAMRRIPANQLAVSLSPFPSRYLDTLVAQGNAAKAKQVLEELANIYLGSAEKRLEFLRSRCRPKRNALQTVNTRIDFYAELMQGLARNPTLQFLVLEQIEPFEHLLRCSSDGCQSRSFRGTENGFFQKDPQKTVALLEASPWLADARQFRIFPAGFDARQWALGQVMEEHRWHASKKNAIYAALRNNQKNHPTFGRGLILAAVDQKTNRNALLDYLEKSLDAIKTMSAKTQVELAAIINTVASSEALQEMAACGKWPTLREWRDKRQAERAADILATYRNVQRVDDLQDASSDYSDVGGCFGWVLPELVRDHDTRDAVELFFQFASVVEKAKRQEGRDPYEVAEHTASAEVFARFLQQHASKPHPKWLVLAIDILASPKGTTILCRDTVQAVFLEQVYNEIKDLAHGRKAEIPKQQDAAAVRVRIETLYHWLATNLDGRPGALLIPAIYRVIQEQKCDRKALQLSVDWTKQESRNGKYPKIAADLHACLRMAQENAPADNGAHGQGAPVRRDMADYDEHFRTLLDDDTQSLPARLTVAAFVADGERAWQLPTPLAFDVVKLYVTVLEKEVVVVGGQHNALIKTLRALVEDKFTLPKAKELAAIWRDRFAKRFLHSGAAIARQYSLLNAMLQEGEVISTAVRLYLAGGDAERANLLLSKYDGPLSQSSVNFTLLVRYGAFDSAERFFHKYWTLLDVKTSVEMKYFYDAELLKNTPAFLAKLSDDGERFIAEILLAALPDAKPGDAGASVPPREDRLLAIAKKFKDVKFAKKPMRSKALLCLVDGKTAAAFLENEIASEYKDLDLGEILDNFDMVQDKAAKAVVQCYLKSRLAANDVSAFVDLLDRLPLACNSSCRLSELTTLVLQTAWEALKDGNTAWTCEQNKKAAASLRENVVDRQDDYSNDASTYVTLLLLTHVQSGESDKLLAWNSSLPNELRDRLSWLADFPDSVFAMLKKGLGQSTKKNLPQRLSCVRDVLRVSAVNGWFGWRCLRRSKTCVDSISVFDHVIKSGILTADELRENGSDLFKKEMFKKDEQFAVAKAALAAWMRKTKELAKASDLWREAIALHPDKEAADVQYWRSELAEALRAQGRLDEARKVAAEVDEEKFDSDKKEEWNHSASELNPSTVPHPAP